MKMLKSILSTLLVIFKLIPYETKKAIAIYLLRDAVKKTETKIDDNFVEIVIEKL